MSQMCLSNVKDLQCMDAVGKHLQEGIQSICNISTALIDAHVDINIGTCYNYEQIREYVENAETCLKMSENMIKGKLGNLDKSMEHFLEQKERTEEEKKEKKLAMDKLCKDKSCDEEMLHNSKRALDQAEKTLNSEKEALKKEEERMNSCQSLTIAGAVLLVIPFAGWIAGPIMISEGERGRHDAINGIRAAEEEIRKAESEVGKYNSKLTNYQSSVSEAQNKINKTNNDLKKIQDEIERLKQLLVHIAEIQATVRRAVHLLSVLSGRVTVLQEQTKRFILWEPVVNVMKEVMMAAIGIAENQLLYSQGLPGLVNTLKQNSGRLLAIRHSPENSKDDSYY